MEECLKDFKTGKWSHRKYIKEGKNEEIAG
jgi:hypothetical protein